MHKFIDSKVIGDYGEYFLDQYFESIGYTIRQASKNSQIKYKIDRQFLKEKNGKLYSWFVEYKTDKRSIDTGNIFLETISNSVNNTPGWLFATKADVIITLVPDKYIIGYYIKDLRDNYTNIWKDYKVVTAINENYKSFGVIVTVQEYIELSKIKVVKLNEIN